MKKFLYFALSCAMVLGLASCQSEEILYEFSDSPEVSFMAKSAIYSMLPTDGNKIAVTLYRGNTKGEASVPVKITDGTDGVFTASKSTFDFADGENAAVIEFTYPDINAFGGETYEIKIDVINEDQVSPSGISSCVVEATRKLTLVELGTGIFDDPVLFEDKWEQDIITTVEAPDLFYLPDCFANGVDVSFNAKNGVFTIAETVDTGVAYDSSDPRYGNFGISGAKLEYNPANNSLVLTGILCLPAVPHDFCPYYGEFFLPAGFDVNKYFGI